MEQPMGITAAARASTNWITEDDEDCRDGADGSNKATETREKEVKGAGKGGEVASDPTT